MATQIDSDVFARLVGAYPDRDTLLFEVSAAFIRAADGNSWSDPVRFRFVRREGAKVDLEFHHIDPTYIAEPSDEEAA